MRDLKEIHGLIFKRQKYKEADLLVKILTKEMGLVSLLVRGALRPKSKLNAATLNFSYGSYLIYTRGKGFSTLRTCKQVRQLTSLYQDFKKNAYASFILDLVDHAFLEYQPLSNYYELIRLALNKIAAGDDPELITQLVQMQLLKAFGVQPELTKCVLCGKTKGRFDYSIKRGGIICSDHFGTEVHRLNLTPKQTAVLRTIGLLPLQRLGHINLQKQTKRATRHAIDRIYGETVGLHLKSKKFLDELHFFNGAD